MWPQHLTELHDNYGFGDLLGVDYSSRDSEWRL